MNDKLTVKTAKFMSLENLYVHSIIFLSILLSLFEHSVMHFLTTGTLVNHWTLMMK